MSNEASPLKDAIMDAVYTPLERDDMQTPCTLPFMTSSEHGVCDGDGCPVSDETIASALNAVAKIQTEYYKVKKETQKGIQKEMSNETSPRPWQVRYGDTVADATGAKVAACWRPENAVLIVDAVNGFLHGEDALLTPCHSGRDGQFRGVPDRQDGNTRTSGDGTERRASLLLPWTVEGPFTGLKPTRKRDGFSAYSNIVNRVGVYVTQNLQPEVAALIVDAVNKRDRLRDIVRRMADTLEHVSKEHRFDFYELVREARAALGEEKE